MVIGLAKLYAYWDKCTAESDSAFFHVGLGSSKVRVQGWLDGMAEKAECRTSKRVAITSATVMLGHCTDLPSSCQVTVCIITANLVTGSNVASDSGKFLIEISCLSELSHCIIVILFIVMFLCSGTCSMLPSYLAGQSYTRNFRMNWWNTWRWPWRVRSQRSLKLCSISQSLWSTQKR